ncbi:MAG: aspartate aminotransferase family protein, partial [Saprospiraceae bacterium]|nr:aspartate aminotransferase family protein [Saprospiraceae bacterium]
GHSHPAVVKAVKEQAELYMHVMVYGDFVLSPQVQLAQALASRLPSPLESVYFVNSGAEAIEGAMKLAKKGTGRHQIIACANAYHGSTHGAASLMSDERFTQPFMPLLPGVGFIEFNKFEDLEHITDQTAAVVMETVQGEVGLRAPVKEYLPALRNRCTEVGALLVLDEIQAGYGRTGSLFAFQQFDIVPDILCLAKAMGGGMPLGAFIASKELMGSLAHSPALSHITTFGGHPVSCAAGLAVIHTIENEHLVESIPEKSALFRTKLKHSRIRSLRHCGLWFALEFEDHTIVQEVVYRGLKKGILVDWFLFNDHSVRLCPPLTISIDQIEQACQIILSILDDL